MLTETMGLNLSRRTRSELPSCGMKRLSFLSLLTASVALVLFSVSSGACSSTSDAPSDASTEASATDASTSQPDTGTTSDANPTAQDAGCTDSCQKLTLTATYGTKASTFERAQFGYDKTGGKVSGLTTEAHVGGAPECPTQDSPTPKRTLIVSGIPLGSAGKTLTKADGIAVTLLDFEGLLTSKPLDKATVAKVTVVYLPGDAPENAAFDVEATFDQGEVKGHAYASHCATMDE
jgi:hypothetical protein